jgi:F0F1-type ATP synthase membrane subunit b/b'
MKEEQKGVADKLTEALEREKELRQQIKDLQRKLDDAETKVFSPC